MTTILNIYSIRDDKANAHLAPFMLPTSGIAERTFADCVNDPEHSFSKHPDDYTLFHHGTFSVLDGTFELHPMVSLGNGVSFKLTTSPGNS